MNQRRSTQFFLHEWWTSTRKWHGENRKKLKDCGWLALAWSQLAARRRLQFTGVCHNNVWQGFYACVNKQVIFLAEQLGKSWLKSFPVFESMSFKVVLEDTGKCWRGLGGGGVQWGVCLMWNPRWMFRHLTMTNALVDCIWSVCVSGGGKSNSMMFSTPSPPIKVINAMPELPQRHGLWVVPKAFVHISPWLVNTITLPLQAIKPLSLPI